MSDPAEPTQEARLANGKSMTIRVPYKADVIAALRKVAKVDREDDASADRAA